MTPSSPWFAAGLLAASACLATAHAAELISNGSFENGLNGWTSSGAVQALVGEGASDGTVAAIFNYDNAPPSGILSQGVATIAGTRYQVSFDYWGFSRAVLQKVHVDVTGGATLVSTTLSAMGGIPADYHHFSVLFTADSALTTVSFTDVTPPGNTVASDLGLDNVSITDNWSDLTGSLTGLRSNARLSIVCANVTTGQAVDLPSLEIDCKKAGLAIGSGDIVRLTVKGAAR